ncbi:hypothetical protein ALC57_17075 [Trachymyrmex cornetzi]|uniref:Uncharacterized protein n=1 Tax=Trachymyrmex cornetzi TaxID=471704 RepID=A0A151ITX2_9HYME|nr:hypothetical protein ALC57_17075 [Trachymyrmex cornetzi]
MISSTMISFWRFSSSSPITTFVYITSTISIRSMSKSETKHKLTFCVSAFGSQLERSVNGRRFWMDPLNFVIVKNMNFEEVPSLSNHSSDATVPSYPILTNYFRHQYLAVLETVFPYLKEFVSENQRFPH